VTSEKQERAARAIEPERPMTRNKKLALAALAVVFLAINVDGISRRFRKRTHFAVASVPQIAYPRCAGDDAGAPSQGESLLSSALVALPMAVDRGAWERFELRARGCHRVVTVHRESPREVVDGEVAYDESMRPIRAWRRIGKPSPRGVQYDTRTYEFRTPFVTVTRVEPNGRRSYEELRPKEKPTIVLAPSNAGVITWIQSARLSAGGRVEAWVLDLRDPLERAWRSTLRRETDMNVDGLGRVRVYALDEESYFVDDQDRVIGTLSGMREPSRIGQTLPAEFDGQLPAEPWR
jgi:hypothetical protein